MSMKWKILITFIGVAAVTLPWPIFAGVCAQRVVKQRVVSYAYAQPVYQAVAYQQAYSPYNYAIGSDLVLEALAEKLALRIEEKLIQRQEAAAPPPSIVAEKCARCHTPNSKAVVEGEAPTFFSPTGELIATSEQRAAMRTAAKFGVMPPAPAQPLDDDSYLALKVELERGIVRPAEPQRWAQPPVEPQRAPPADPRGLPPENLPSPPPAPPEQ
jgi:hypothetical protein